MAGQADAHEVSEDAKQWLAWFKQSGACPEIVQAHEEYEARGGAVSSAPAAAAASPSGQDGATNPGGKGSGASLVHLSKILADAEATVAEELNALRDEMVAEFGEDAEAAKDLEAGYETHVKEVMRMFNGHFASGLAEAAKSSDQANAAVKVRAQIDQFSKQVAGDKTIALLDGNPFVHVDIGGSLKRALEEMTKALR